MSVKSRYQKKFNFPEMDRSWITQLFKERDEVEYPTESDFLVFILRSVSERGEPGPLDIVTEAQIEEKMRDTCPDTEPIHPGYSARGVKNKGSKFLERIGKYFVCLKAGGGKVKYFKVDSEAMTLDEVRRICARCRDPWSKYKPVEGSEGHRVA